MSTQKREGAWLCEGVRLCDMCEAYGSVTQEMGLCFLAIWGTKVVILISADIKSSV